jgi:hypothetical protein
MRRRPSICDACRRLRQRPNPDAVTSVDRYIPYCEAFPAAIPAEIYLGGFDHRHHHPGDNGVLFSLRDRGERALTAFEHRLRITP